jgi:ubiquinone/menaquinone biosynthesis C-methylase UbiE
MYQKAFSKQARFYADYRPAYPEEMYRFIFQHLNRKKTAWDCGTGTGQVAGYLAGHFETVHASDINSEQLKHAVQKKNIRYSNTPAEQTGYPDSIFDLITVAQAIHWFNFDAFYREVQRTARKDALLAVIGYGMFETGLEIDSIIGQFYEDTFGCYFSECRKYVEEKYNTIPFPFDEIPSPQFSISVEWSLEHLDGFFNSWSAVQAFRDEHGYSPADEIMKKIRETVGNDSIKGTFPVFIRLGRVFGGEG